MKVTDCPNVEEFAEEVTTTLEPTWLTVWMKAAGEVLAALLASPLYAAVI